MVFDSSLWGILPTSVTIFRGKEPKKWCSRILDGSVRFAISTCNMLLIIVVQFLYASVHKKSIQKIRCIGFNSSTTNACNNQVLNFSIDELVNVGVLLSGSLAFYNFANITICAKNYSIHRLYYVFQNCVVVCNLPL